jgi:hypothetical protein
MTVYRVHLLYIYTHSYIRTHTQIYIHAQWAFEEQFPISHNHMAFPYVYMFVFLDGALVAMDSNNRYYLILLLPSDKKKKGF